MTAYDPKRTIEPSEAWLAYRGLFGSDHEANEHERAALNGSTQDPAIESVRRGHGCSNEYWAVLARLSQTRGEET